VVPTHKYCTYRPRKRRDQEARRSPKNKKSPLSRHGENYNFVFRGYLGGENTKITK
jgi:hypothetical protein